MLSYVFSVMRPTLLPTEPTSRVLKRANTLRCARTHAATKQIRLLPAALNLLLVKLWAAGDTFCETVPAAQWCALFARAESFFTLERRAFERTRISASFIILRR